jgi:putative ABC transport system permease protein
MLKNYFKIAWRNLKRNKSYAAINIIGLSLGIASSILIFTLVSFHLSYENFNKNKDRIYRVVTELHSDEVSYTPGTPPPFAKAMRDDYSFAEKTAQAVTFWDELISIPASTDNKKFQEENGFTCVDPEFFDIFNFPLVQGDIKTALNDPFTALVTQKIAKKYFGTEDAIGKVFRVDNKTDFKITGILKDIPLNTDRKQEIYVSHKSLKTLSDFLASDNWGGINSETHCFLLLKPNVTAKQVEAAFPGLKKKYYKENAAGPHGNFFKMQPLSDIHFNPDYDGYADKKYLWALIFVGIFLIVTACVNFINLATAQALNRAKEVGIRKVLGSMRFQLFWHFIAETALITLFAILVAYGFAFIGLPYLNGLFKTQLSINPFANIGLLIFILVTAVIVVFLSGAYPGLVLSGFQPVAALKGKLSQKSIGGFSLRRVLVVTQFAISQILIIGTIVIAGQMNFSKKSDLGFRKDAIVMLPVPQNDSVGLSKMQTLRDRLAGISGVEKISFCMQAPASQSNNVNDITYDNRPKPELWGVNAKDADESYVPTFDLKIVAGRNLYKSDTVREFLVNETFVRKLNLKSPQDMVNKFVTIGGKHALVVGVVKDFYNYSFRTDISPVAIFSNFHQYQNCAVKINLADIKPTLNAIEKIWNDTYPQYVYSSQFLDERIAKFYELDDIMLKLIEAFAGIAIFIGCLGLYGLVSFMAVRKTKEIGVRKVLGANLSSIIWLFGKEFSRLLIIAFFIAAPLGWWAMTKYLQDFKYRIPISAGIFVLAIVATFIVAALTVGYKSLQASLANPVKSLRSE